jgi:hypothetical protein
MVDVSANGSPERLKCAPIALLSASIFTFHAIDFDRIHHVVLIDHTP